MEAWKNPTHVFPKQHKFPVYMAIFCCFCTTLLLEPTIYSWICSQCWCSSLSLIIRVITWSILPVSCTFAAVLWVQAGVLPEALFLPEGRTMRPWENSEKLLFSSCLIAAALVEFLLFAPHNFWQYLIFISRPLLPCDVCRCYILQGLFLSTDQWQDGDHFIHPHWQVLKISMMKPTMIRFLINIAILDPILFCMVLTWAP